MMFIKQDVDGNADLEDSATLHNVLEQGVLLETMSQSGENIA